MLKRPMSVYFPLKESGRVDREKTLESIVNVIDQSDVRGIQITDSKCIISLVSTQAKDVLCSSGLDINARHISLIDIEQSLTNVTIKDAPIEMDDNIIATMLQPFGNIIPGSIKRGKMRGTEIETGTRFLKMANVKNIIPCDFQAGSYPIKVYCDNNKTACKHCGLTNHPFYNCPVKPQNTIRCYRCQGTDHVKANCMNDILCLLCGISGHIRKDCPENTINLRSEERPCITLQQGPNRASLVANSIAHDDITTHKDQTTCYSLTTCEAKITPDNTETLTDNNAKTPDDTLNKLAFRGAKHPLSNLYIVNCGVVYDSKTYKSVEHAYKATKVSYFCRDDLLAYIDSTENALVMMQHIDEELKFDICEEWTTSKQGIMQEILKSKYERCSAFKDYLLGTQDKYLVEATNNTYWASGVPGINQTLDTPRNKWPGQNRLGQMLMNLRKEAREREKVQNTIQVTAEIHAQPTTPKTKYEEKKSEKPAGEQEEIVDEVITVILSDSMLNEVTNKDPAVKIIAKPGYSLDNTKDLISVVMKQKLPYMENVVLCLGTLDIQRTQSAPVTQIKLQKAIQTVQAHLPDVEVFVSAIVPRRGKSNEVVQDCNNIHLVNEYAKLISSPKPHVHFISNATLFNLPHPNAVGRYKKDDKFGIHLNKQGKSDLLKNMKMNCVSQRYTSTPVSKKRFRSTDTPQSSEKSAKAYKTMTDGIEIINLDTENV